MKILLNFAGYQLGWFACVLGVVYDQTSLGLLIAAMIISVHVLRATLPAREVVTLTVAVIAGTLWESVLVSAGLITYRGDSLYAGMAPYWIIMLWALFATMFNLSLHWLRRRWLLAAVCSFLGAPPAFWAGEKLGALEMVMPDALIAQAIGYAILVPLLLRFALDFDGYGHPKSAYKAEPVHD